VEDDEDDLDVTDDEELKGGKPDDDIEFEDYDDGFIRPHPDVRTSVHFPDFPDRKFDLGARVNALVGFNNRGDYGFNVTAVGAFFHSPYDYSYFIQNFSYREIGVVLSGHWQVTFEYIFAPDKGLEPIDYWLSGWIDYNSSDGREYRSTWYNGTVTLVEKNAEFDIRKIFSYGFLLVLAGLIGYLAFNWSTISGGKKKKERKPFAERTTAPPKETTDADWGSIYKPAETSRRVGSKKPVSAKKKSAQSSESSKTS